VVNNDKPLVLVIEDDPDTLQLEQRYLEAAGCAVVGVDSGSKALALVKTMKPDLILLDLVLPEMDGHQVCATLQQSEDTALIPVIFVTGRGEDQDKARAFAAGAADYVMKPLKREALLEVVTRHLETRSRWYSVKAATDLWDERSLPEKFVQFREHLVKNLELGPEAAFQDLARLKESEVYSFGAYLNLSERDLAKQMADFFGLPYVEGVEAQSIQLGILPTSFCRSQHVVAIKDEHGKNAFVISNPFVWGLEQLDLLNRAFRGEPYHLLITEQKTISALFIRDVAEARAEAVKDEDRVSAREIPIESLPVTDGVSAVDVVRTIIADAVRRGASDLHIEPERDRIRIRYRIDGRMQYVVPIQPALMPGITGRIKILSGLDPSETRKPQDGGCAVRVDNRDVEVRVSSLPSNHGEVMVLRFLGESHALHRLETLGMEPPMLRQLRALLTGRQGMVLITGPTGSGKTTTLYAALNHLNTDDVNIVTVEDPIEVDVVGINQIQINDRAGRSFAGTLRAMLRQDPDIIMVGEIRDVETAEIACRAALTGHLVLSTLHTQHTLGSLTRLADMGIPSYLVGSSLNGVLAQRLVRRVCDDCAEPYQPSPNLMRTLEAEYGDLSEARFRKGKGCARCHRTGARGRLGIFELLTVDDDLRHLVAEGSAPSTLRNYVRGRGFRSLEDDAFLKASRGLIPPEEIVNLGFGLAMQAAEEGEAEELVGGRV
jgi:type IV pilus assembly protein PilB